MNDELTLPKFLRRDPPLKDQTLKQENPVTLEESIPMPVSTDPFSDPEIIKLKEGIQAIDIKIKELQKEKAGYSRIMRSRLNRLISAEISRRKKAESQSV